MEKSDARRDYFTWLNFLVEAPENYSLLMIKLHRTAYIWIIERDGDRAADGKSLRYKYAIGVTDDSKEIDEIKDFLSGPCSVLEFLVALARRIELNIMADPDIGDRTSEWFREMLDNLDLLKYDDKNYSEIAVDYILNRFMERKYGDDGVGNIFKNNVKGGLQGGLSFQDIDVATQMHMYANTNWSDF